MAVNPQHRYLEIQTQTATPEKLVTMLYDGAIRFMSQAKAHIEQKDYAKANNSLIRSQEIIQELSATLNKDAGEIAISLQSLYEFMLATLVEANIHKDCAKIDDVIGLVSDLRGAWIQATTRHGQNMGQGTDRLDIAQVGR